MSGKAKWRDPPEFYADHAQRFDAVRSRALVERGWLEAFCALLPPGGTVLDLGCGAGDPIATWLLAQGLAVTGVDAVKPLLDLARSRFPAGEWIEADMRALPLGRSFDGIVAWDSLFHLDAGAQRTCMAAIAAHVAPGAALLFNSGTVHGESANPMFDEPLFHASLDKDEYHALLERHGFRLLRHVEADADCGGRTIWLAQKT